MSDALKQRFFSLAVNVARPVVKALPLWVEAVGFGVALLNSLDKNPGARKRLAELDGKLFLFEATDVGKRLYLHFTHDDVMVLAHAGRPPDVTMRGETAVLMGVFTGAEDPDTVFFSRRLEIAGDTASALFFKNVLLG